MSVTIDQREVNGEGFIRLEHPGCFVCGRENRRGMQVEFFRLPDGSVEADSRCRPEHQGYEGIMHGGLISSLLDEAMTQCMLGRKTPALTAKLEVRYVHTVEINSRFKVRAWLVRSRPPLFELEAVLMQNNAVAARAKAKFYQKRGVGTRPQKIAASGLDVKAAKVAAGSELGTGPRSAVRGK